MFAAIGRYLSALGYLFTGQIDKARQALETDPNVIRATFDDVVRQKLQRIQEFMSAVATLIRQQEQKKSEKERLEGEIKKHEGVMNGAKALAQKRVAVLQGQGLTPDKIMADPEVVRHQGAYTDAKSSVDQKRGRVAQLEQGIQTAQGQINKHKTSLEGMQREIQGLKSEAADAVARVISAREEKALADMLMGLSTSDKTGERLASIREVVGQAEAEARVSSELAGTDAAHNEAQYLAQAAEAEASNEFAALLGLDQKVETAAPAATERAAATTEKLG